MIVSRMNWFQVEEYLRSDDRCVVPLGSTEQHAYLSLATDSILAERIAAEAAGPLGIPVFPALPYGITPFFMAFPGTVSITLQTYTALVRDILDSLYVTGFRRILVCNAHGGNSVAGGYISEWLATHEDCRVKFHDWWMAPATRQAALTIESVATHASWSENFPWTRLDDAVSPAEQKVEIDVGKLRRTNPARARELLGDGSFGGSYQRPDDETMRLWDVAVEETKLLLSADWD